MCLAKILDRSFIPSEKKIIVWKKVYYDTYDSRIGSIIYSYTWKKGMNIPSNVFYVYDNRVPITPGTSYFLLPLIIETKDIREVGLNHIVNSEHLVYTVTKAYLPAGRVIRNKITDELEYKTKNIKINIQD